MSIAGSLFNPSRYTQQYFEDILVIVASKILPSSILLLVCEFSKFANSLFLVILNLYKFPYINFSEVFYLKKK